MKKYKSQRIVEAAKIEAIEIGHDDLPNAKLFLDGGGFVTVNAEWLSKHGPESGGYFVCHEDGHESYSPPEVFEAEYKEVDLAPKQGMICDRAETEAEHFRRRLGECESKLCAAHIDIIEAQAAHIETLEALSAERLKAMQDYRAVLEAHIHGDGPVAIPPKPRQ